MDKNKGFTLIEFLVIVFITLFFLGVSLPRYNDYNGQLKLKNEGKKLVDVLELAKKKALSGDLYDKNCTNFNGYKITIASGSYSLSFKCALVYTLVQSYSFPTNIIATTTGDFIFTPLMINPSFVGNTIRLRNSGISKCVDISVSPIGIFELNESLISC